jgi:hypothetical protein
MKSKSPVEYNPIQIHFEIIQKDDDKTESDFISAGTFTTNEKFKYNTHGHGEDVDREYLCGAMGMQHESCVMYDVLNWTKGKTIDPNKRYLFEVLGYKGTLKHIGDKPYQAATMPLSRSSLSELVSAYASEQDEATLKEIFKLMTIKEYKIGVKDYDHDEFKPEIEGDSIIFPKKQFKSFMRNFNIRRR